MTDIALVWNPQTQRADLGIENGDFVREEGLLTAVVMSLFTDARANDDDEMPDGTDNRRGWWADQFMEQPFGSRLWLLDRAKEIPDTLRAAEHYADEALQWLIDRGIAREIINTASFPRKGFICLETQIYRPRDVAQPWRAAWEFELNA